MAEVGHIYIDFDVISTRPENLIVNDASQWFYAEDLPAFIYITLPGSKKPKIFPFVKYAWNRFNSHLLGLSCFRDDCGDEKYIALPDGIYTICLKSGYDNIFTQKYYLKTDQFKRDFAERLVKEGMKCGSENRLLIEEMQFIDGLMRVAESHAMLGEIKEAQRFYDEAVKKLKKCPK